MRPGQKPSPPPEPIDIPATATVNPLPENGIDGHPTPSVPPVHPLSALLLVVVDNLWNLADWAVISWAVTVPLSFVTVFLPAFCIQRLMKRDSLLRALGLAFLLGALAAVPTSVTGTPVGLALLAWTGLNRLFGKNLPSAARPRSGIRY